MSEKLKEKKYKILKIILLIAFIILMISIITKIIPYFNQLSSSEGREILKAEIKDLGIYGVLVIIGLMIAQIFFLFLPGEPVEILAGMCYGNIGGLLVIYLGAFISSCLIMFLIRKLGRNFIYTFVSKEKIEKMENSKIFKSKKLEVILMLLFALPGTPKDLITYIGAFLPIKPLRFILISTLARFPSIITSTIVGNNLLEGNWLFIGSVYLITFIVSVVVIYFLNKKEKIEDIMKI